MNKVITRYNSITEVDLSNDSKDNINIHIVDIRDVEIFRKKVSKPQHCTLPFGWLGDFSFGSINMYDVRQNSKFTTKLFLIVDDDTYVDVVWNFNDSHRFGGFVSTEEQFNNWLNMEVLN